MTIINLNIEIYASIEVCFDLARNIDAHVRSTSKTKERAIAGKTTGLCEKGDYITWEGNHFGIRQRLTVEITKLNKPYFFEDRIVKGAFKSMRHEHHFEEINGNTLMSDYFEYEVPFGILGKLFDDIILKKYMTRFLTERNEFLKAEAETNAPLTY